MDPNPPIGQIRLDQINLVVTDIEESLRFFRLLGIPFGEPGGPHASYQFPGGPRLELDQQEFGRVWNSGTPDALGGAAVFTVSVPSRPAVDDLWLRMRDAGYESRQRPYDAFWGARYAIIADPDGYQIGLMSPPDADLRFWPPSQAPGPD